MGSSQELLVQAGPHARQNTPLSVEIKTPLERGSFRLRDLATGVSLPVQVDGAKVVFVLPSLTSGEERRLRLEPGTASELPAGVKLLDGKVNGLAIEVDGQPFTNYRYLPEGEFPVKARPFFYPVLGPGGASMTRNFPMRTGVAGETQDHPHHRGIYVAYGDVNGVDNWSEEKGHGFQTHREFTEVISGSVFGRFSELLHWESNEHKPVCEEQRSVTIWNLPRDGRVLDLSVTFKASQGTLKFGDTKEGGICSIRVPTVMDGNKGGTIENSANGIGEGECWGKSAHWVDYYGLVEGRQVGVAILDHPMNLRHPAPWHVRDYGLFSANPFAQSYYKSSLLQNGDYTVEAGGTLVFRYRIYIHRGDTRRGDVVSKWSDYAFPPKAKWSE